MAKFLLRAVTFIILHKTHLWIRHSLTAWLNIIIMFPHASAFFLQTIDRRQILPTVRYMLQTPVAQSTFNDT